MATFEELAAEGGDASFGLQLGDNVLGTLGDADTQDVHTARLYAGHSYSFTLSYFLITDPITLVASRGSDTFILPPASGGLGFKTFTLSFVASENGVYGFDLETSAGITLIYDFAFTVDITPQGTEQRDLITGSIIEDYVDLGGGDDYMRGLAGDDTIFGGTGRDRILGDDGNDSIDGGDDDDYIIGGRGDDMLIGGSGRDRFEAGQNNDTVVGGTGNDVIVAGGGNDMVYAGANNDRVYAGGGHDTVFAGSGNDLLRGNGGDDLLIAGNGKDVIHGGNGADTIISGGGDDLIRGGAGADLFIFERGMDEDVINDFEDGSDILDFSAFGFTQLSDLDIFQSGSDAVVAYNHDWFVTLRNFDSALLDDSDFVWAALL